MLIIREATLKDLAAITDIYNEAVLKTTATFDTEIKTLDEQQAWWDRHQGKYPVLVAELDGIVAGWISLSAWSDRLAYAGTAEVSLYIKEEYRGQGLGKKLTGRIIEEGRKKDLHTLIVRITEGNAASLHLVESCGFKNIGVMKEVGRKFGKLLDVSLLQFIYKDSSS